MKKVKVLDCTLRDGGRIINCEFDDKTILGMLQDLSDANIDIVEIGFLRDKKMVEYKGNSTFFTEPEQIDAIVSRSNLKADVVAFIDYGMYDFGILPMSDGHFVKGIRVGFTKKQFESKKEEIREALNVVKERGYKLFVQGVNSLAYSDREMLDLIDLINDIHPYSFGIVDTYGAMYLEDLVHYYDLIDYNLDEDISIDIHSHNNFQSSFAFAQEIVRLSEGKRNIILDSTLNGMGKCAGNLNTELIADYLNKKKYFDYDLDLILDSIDRYLTPLRDNNMWGYSIPAFMAGKYKSHPNNIIYLTEKYRLSSKDIKYIISGIDEDKRQRYDYDNIQKIYKEYNDSVLDDAMLIDDLKSEFKNKKVLVLAPGSSILNYRDEISKIANDEKTKVISVSFVPADIRCDYHFFANAIRWGQVSKYVERSRCIVTSNIHEMIDGTKMVSYSSLITEDSKLYDNSTIMLLNLLKRSNVSEILIAGFDGLKDNEENYAGIGFVNSGHGLSVDENNSVIRKMFNDYCKRMEGKATIKLITPSIYE